MKKLIALASTITALSMPIPAFADINIIPPKQGYKDIGSFISNIITVAFSIAILVVLIMLIWGAFEWIVSGGDKEAVGKARGRIINALIGLAVLAVAFALASLGSQILGIPITTLPIPTPPPQ